MYAMIRRADAGFSSVASHNGPRAATGADRIHGQRNRPSVTDA
jgi:hypothetical protein